MLENGFHFIAFFFSFNVRWWSSIVWSMDFSFNLWFQKGSMEGVVNAPGFGELEFVCEQS